MNIYEALTYDHDKLKSILNKLHNLDKESDVRKNLINSLKEELIPHSRAEEAVFYNSLRSIKTRKKIIDHSYQEHIKAEALLRALQMKSGVDKDWKKTLNDLKESLEAHINEEESHIFNVAQQLLSADEEVKLAEAFNKMKSEVMKKGSIGTTLDLIINLMPPRFTKSLRETNSVSQ